MSSNSICALKCRALLLVSEPRFFNFGFNFDLDLLPQICVCMYVCVYNLPLILISFLFVLLLTFSSFYLFDSQSDFEIFVL